MHRFNVDEFKWKCREYLMRQGIAALRPYGRAIGVSEPTAKSKGVLIEDIISILAGEVEPKPRSSRGAPIKDDHVDPSIYSKIKEYCNAHPFECEDGVRDGSDFLAQMKFQSMYPTVFYLRDSNPEPKDKEKVEIYEGQFQMAHDVPTLFPMDLNANDKPILLTEEMVQAVGLREGDIVTCRAKSDEKVMIATVLLTVNGVDVAKFKRVDHFDELSACEPKKRLSFYWKPQAGAVSLKFFEWMLPMGKGQRAVISSAPMGGKSSMLLELVTALQKAEKNVTTLVLLVDQPPENVGNFRKIVYPHNLIYTTYEDPAEKQVFAADLLLNRAKRMAEAGKDVCLIVDSFNALARAYNYTDFSVGGKTLAGGMESKTLQYVKRYLGTARCFEKKGSLTIIGALSTETGDPADELLETELNLVCNLKLPFNEELARKRVYPAIDLVHCKGKEKLLSKEEAQAASYIRNHYISKHGLEQGLAALSKAWSLSDLQKIIKKDSE